MKILVIGNGGREHALAWKAAQSPQVDTVFVAPGNAGTALEPALQNVAIGVTDIPALLSFAQSEKIDLTIVGPEAPLVIGVVDAFRAAGLKIFGPTEGAAQLEGSKAFTKDFLARHNIPTAEYQNFTEVEPALAYLREKGAPIVIKADGLAAGKGVIVAMTLEEAEAAVHDMLAGNAFGDPETQPIMLRMKSDLVDLCLAACDGKLNERTSEWDERASLGVVIAAGGYPGNYSTGDEIHGLPLEEAADGKVFHAGTRLADDDRVLTSGGRVLCATALGHTVAEAQKRAYALMNDIRWDGSFSRNDIGWRAIEREQNS